MRRIRHIGALLLTFFSALMWAQSPHTIFTRELAPEQLRADFDLFRKSLEKIHPGLYRYTPKSKMDSIFSLAEKQLSKPMLYSDFYKLLAGINSQVRCQHTAITPGQKEMDNISNHAKMFPYEIMWEFDPVKAYAFADLTHEGDTKFATEILSINGQSVKAVYDTLIKYLFADGYNITSKQVRMTSPDFPYWYYMLIERPDKFTMEFRIDGSRSEKIVSAVSRSEYRQNSRRYIRESKDPLVRKLVSHNQAQRKLSPYRLEFRENATAVLTLKEFGPLEFIHKSFETIKEKKTENLIIDVRGNGGGYDNQGFTLFSYLINKPTYYYDSIYTTAKDIEFLLRHTDKDTAWWKTTEPLLENYDGKRGIRRVPENGFLQQPQKNRFTGNVYVLIDGKSMSTTAEFTAAAHYNQLATFIGDESGGAYCGGNGGDFATVILPHSGLSLNLPLSKYVMAIPSSHCNGQGTIPHFRISKKIKDWLDVRDPQMEFALKQIAVKKK